jgi:small subunit ribosomal protein S9
MSEVQNNRWYATGKRKRAIARVWLSPGEGKITINGRKMEEYFPRQISQMILTQPLELVKAREIYNVWATVKGGGLSGQADAVKYGIAKALVLADKDRRPILKKTGFLKRDARKKERKKYGQPGARKKFQYSKR